MYHWLKEVTGLGFWPPAGRMITATIITFIALGVVFFLLTRPKSEKPTTWAQSMGGATGAMALFFLGYAVIPSEWIIFANSYLNWNKDRFLFKQGWAPISISMASVNDTVAVLIYGVFFAINLALWSLWQKRGAAKPEETAEGVPTRRSRFGRPLKTTGA